MIALVVAYDKNRVIGNKGIIPWNIPKEKRRFKELTTGNVVIIGRVSYEEIGHPLPERMNIVVSKTKKFDDVNCFTVGTLEEAIKLAGDKDIYIAGGEKLYKEALTIVDKMYITEIDIEVEGDRFFPNFSEEEFLKETNESFNEDTPYTYFTYSRL
ncbi:MAG: dihydrofolate reductase [Filifactoraceae bacterium]